MYKEVLKIAEKIKSELTPFCERIEIAGSIRRKKKEPNDVEIVAIPLGREAFELKHFLEKFKMLKGSFPGKYIRLFRNEDGIFIDLFLCTVKNFWMIFVIRTGNAEFSHFLVTRAKKLGYRVKDGMLFDKNGIPFEIESEEEIFERLKLHWLPPEKRNMVFRGYEELEKTFDHMDAKKNEFAKK